MRKGEALLKVKEAERQVETMRKGASDEKERVLKEARMEVLRIQDESRRKADEALQQRIEAGKKEIDVKRAQILEQGQKEAEIIRQKGQSKIDPAVSLLLRRFEEGVVAVPTERDV